jgi:hypothetical protein
MTVLCPGCQRRIRVPPEKAATPNLRAKCVGCGTVFAVAQAAVVPDAAPVPPATAPVAPAPNPPAVIPPTGPAAPAPPQSPAAAAPRPAAPRVAPPPAAAAPSPAAVPARPSAAAAGTPPLAARSRGRGNWRFCANHSAIVSEGVCTKCGRGLCADCVTRQGPAAICPSCDALCVPAAEQEKKEERARARARPLLADIGTVFTYPFTDKIAFVIFAVFVGVFSLAAAMAGFGGGIGAFISQGLLYAYAFTAVNRVCSGDLSGFMPNLSDWTDLVQPMRAGIGAMLISSGPLIGLTFLYSGSEVLASLGGERVAAMVAPTPTPEASPTLPPEVAAALQDDEEDPAASAEEAGQAQVEGEGATGLEVEPESPTGVPAWFVLALVLAIVWKVVYSPIALVAGAISQSFLATLNPLAGLSAIRRMGGTYWTAMAVYTGIVVVEAVVVGVVGLIPIAGKLINGFVQSYAFLAIGCLLGLAAFKKAPELGLD